MALPDRLSARLAAYGFWRQSYKAQSPKAQSYKAQSYKAQSY